MGAARPPGWKWGAGKGRKIDPGLTLLTVFPARHSGDRHAARLQAGAIFLRAAIGRSGATCAKREGDGATPTGRFKILGGYIRRDRGPRAATQIAVRDTSPSDGWCDDPGRASYNRPVPNTFAGGHEKLWRDDRIYDVVLVLDYNLHPNRKHRGSAIFFHLARDGYAATEGCVAISAADMRRLLPRLSRAARIEVRR